MEHQDSEGKPLENVLVIDDEEFITDLFKDVLEPDYQVTAANDGWKALECIMEKDYDLIVSDLMMPYMNGMELYDRIKEKKPGLEKKMFFVSGCIDREPKEFLMKTGNPFLPKPFSMNSFLEKVNQFLDR